MEKATKTEPASQPAQKIQRIKLGKSSRKPRKPGSGFNLRGNSIEEGTHPNVVANREKFRQYRLSLNGAPPGAGRKKNILGNILKDALEATVEIDGKPSTMTVGQVIAQQRINEAMRDAELSPVALEATHLIFDRTEGKPKTLAEHSGPDGGPIEVVETSVVLAKLFS